MILVALDPSVKSCGLAVFVNGTLIHAESVKSAVPGGDAARALAMARRVVNRAREVAPRDHWSWNVVTEWQQVYRAQRSKGDPNALAFMSAVGTAAAALLQAAEVFSYCPAEWAGQVPKADKKGKILPKERSPRARQIRSRLLAAEVPVWEALRSSDHDAIDAIGIGCHHLNRPRLSRP